jgi:endonuclease-3
LPGSSQKGGAKPRGRPAGAESPRQRKARLGRIIEILAGLFPQARTALSHRNPYELLVATILSAQCTDKRVNMVTPDVFSRFPDVHALARARIPTLEKLIESTGFFRNKAKNLKACAQGIVERFGGRVPDSMEELVSLDGVGRKTANVVLGNAFGKDEGVVVDTHVNRLSNLLGLTESRDPVKVEQDLMRLVPRQHWTDFSHWLILHGRATCVARRPRCGDCALYDLCPGRREQAT